MKSVSKFYTAKVADEWKRLVSDSYHNLEFVTTMYFLKKYLPKRGLILDAGGGPGRYTIELAKQGYNVVLLDLTPTNLKHAEKQIKKAKLQNRVKKIVHGSITDLSCFADNTFDAVICLGGPLSHVLSEQKRDKAVSELIRVAKIGAPIAIGVIGRLAILARALKLFPEEIELPVFKRYSNTGDYAGHHGFTAAHFFLPEDAKNLFANKKVKILTMAGLEGIGTNQQEKINSLAKNKKRWRVWLETHYKFCTHPAIVGISEHILIVGKKL